MTYFVKAKTGPKGRQTGYLVCDEEGNTVATFTNKECGFWRFAKDKAMRECERLTFLAKKETA